MSLRVLQNFDRLNPGHIYAAADAGTPMPPASSQVVAPGDVPVVALGTGGGVRVRVLVGAFAGAASPARLPDGCADALVLHARAAAGAAAREPHERQ